MWPYPFWIAHRGGGRLAPENTLAAFRTGAAHGFRAFECDAKLSADGVPFLLHDDTLERTTDGHGEAAALAWTELSQLDAGGWHGAAHAGEPPALLAAVLRYTARNGLALNVEIKPAPGASAATGAAVAALVAQHAALGWTPWLSSFDAIALQAAARAAPALPRSLLFERPPPDWLAQAGSLGCAAVAAHHETLDAALIAAAHAQGLAVLAYTVNDAEPAERLRSQGIDGLFTDDLERFGTLPGRHAGARPDESARQNGVAADAAWPDS